MFKTSLVVSTPEVGKWDYAMLTGSFREKMFKAAELGYDGVELLIRDIDGFDHAEIHRAIAESGISVSALVTGVLFGLEKLSLTNPNPDVSARAWRQLVGFIDFAGEYGAPVDIGLLRGRLDWMPDRQAAKEVMLAHFWKAAEHAKKVGARVTLEPLNRYEADVIHNAQDGLSWVKEVNHPCFGLLLDTFHMNIEDASMEDSVREAGDLLWHVHLGDSNRLPPGRGHLDFASLFSVLDEINFQGYVSAELLVGPDPDAAAQETIHYIQDLNTMRNK